MTQVKNEDGESVTKSAKKIDVEKVYQKKTQLEHILLRPDTYIGSIESLEQEMWVWNFDSEKMIKKSIKFVPGLFKIFDEIIVNAADNKIRDPNMSIIKVNINKEQNMIKVYNNGKGIPIVMHKDEKVFVPTLIFGHLLTSSNYNDDEKKVTGGRNGYGAKLCNIFSKKFIVETSCKESKHYFKQIWTENMCKTQEPNIKPNKDDDFTAITFHPDLSKFGMDELDDDTISLLARRAYDVAASTRGVKVYLNDKKLPISKFEDYCKLYVSSNSGNSDNNDISILNNSSQPKILYESPNPRWEVAISCSDIGFQQVSFVNSIATTKGGRHVDYICEQIIKHLSEVVNKKNGKNNTQVKPFQIKNHLWVFVNCLIENPVFDSQTKESMSSQIKNFGSKCQLSDDFMRKVASKGGIVDRVLNWLAFKEKTDLEKTGSKSKQSKLKGIPKLDDANNAGTKDSINCTLILTEGDSAKTLAVAGLGVIGRDRYGVFPLRGKMLNVREATTKQILDNAEVSNLCKIIGLNFKEKYVSKDSLKCLRYGKVMIMTDQDHDGSHIKGLIINFFHHHWPNLLKFGFVEEFITPIIKVFKSKKNSNKSNETENSRTEIEKSFYSVPEFDEWQKATSDWHTWKIKYYKGLGTSTSKEAKEYFSDMQRHRIAFEYAGTRDDLAIQLAFSKKLVEERKEWLSKFMEERKNNENLNNYLYQKDTKKINFTEFVNKELVLFSNLDNERSIPSIVDGFKPGQRKVIFACFKRNLQKEIKVAQLAGSVAELSAYHHGEQSLMSTIINLAQNFVGSNNFNMLMPIGQFGTRLHGGKDAASPRYIFTCLNTLTRFLFNQRDDSILDYLNDDGQRVEPEFYCPILPTVLLNGSEGIGTAYSSKIPNYNIRDLINNLMRIIKKEEPYQMKPFYKNFKGTINRIDDHHFVVNGEIAILDDDYNGKHDYSIEITELPVGVWTQIYKETVLEQYLTGVESSKNDNSSNSASKASTSLISDYKEYHTDCTVRFIVKMSKTQYQNAIEQHGNLHKFFKLQKTISLSNMVLFDSRGCIKRYSSPIEIIMEFYDVRYRFYQKRKEFMENMLGAESSKLDNISRFILEKIEGKIKVENLKKIDLIKLLAERGYQSDPVRKWKDRITKERGYIHEAPNSAAPETLNSNENENDDENQSLDFNYLLSMPLWNLTLEKKEDIIRQQKLKATELKDLKSKTIEQLWIDDLNEFKVEYEKLELKEKEEFEQSLKKNIKSSTGNKAAKNLGSKTSTIKCEYLPSADGERVIPTTDSQLIAKIEKDVQQKILIKSKKDESSKGLTIVDVITTDGQFNEEQLKEIDELALNIANPNKAKATKATPVKSKVNKEVVVGEIIDLSAVGDDTIGVIEYNDENTEISITDIKNENKSVTNGNKKNQTGKNPTPRKKPEKITIDSDSEKSFEENDQSVNSFEKRDLGRSRKQVKYNFDLESESDNDVNVFDSKKDVQKKQSENDDRDIKLKNSDNESSDSGQVKKKTQPKKINKSKVEKGHEDKVSTVEVPIKAGNSREKKKKNEPKPTKSKYQDDSDTEDIESFGEESDSDFDIQVSLKKKKTPTKKATQANKKVNAKNSKNTKTKISNNNKRKSTEYIMSDSSNDEESKSKKKSKIKNDDDDDFSLD